MKVNERRTVVGGWLATVCPPTVERDRRAWYILTTLYIQYEHWRRWRNKVHAGWGCSQVDQSDTHKSPREISLARLNRCLRLLQGRHGSTLNYVWFTDDKLPKVSPLHKGVGKEWRRDGGARPRNAETTGARVSFRYSNIFPDFCMLFLKLPVVIYLVFYCEMHDNCHYVAYN